MQHCLYIASVIVLFWHYQRRVFTLSRPLLTVNCALPASEVRQIPSLLSSTLVRLYGPEGRRQVRLQNRGGGGEEREEVTPVQKQVSYFYCPPLSAANQDRLRFDLTSRLVD
jgi:hypothetical protein